MLMSSWGGVRDNGLRGREQLRGDVFVCPEVPIHVAREYAAESVSEQGDRMTGHSDRPWLEVLALESRRGRGRSGGVWHAARVTHGDGTWDVRAELAHRALIRHYMRSIGRPGLSVLRSPPRVRDRVRRSYWWQAQVLDALVDAYERAPSSVVLRRMRWLTLGQRLANGGRLRNDYYDDMAWMALALLRAGRDQEAERLWWVIRAGWNDHHGGGIPWRVQQPTYKNTPANGPAAILAARLGDSEWAVRIVDWMETILIDPGSGDVHDGIDRKGDGRLESTWQFSYDYGVALGAELSVGRRPVAERIAQAGIDRCAPDGILRGETRGDGALFKGIFARYLTLLGTEPARRVVLSTAQAYWEHRDNAGRFGPDPLQRPHGPVELSAMLSGVMTIEAAARLSAEGQQV
jgi:predicted alpha-1,6-mannanase (GH76 family)